MFGLIIFTFQFQPRPTWKISRVLTTPKTPTLLYCRFLLPNIYPIMNTLCLISGIYDRNVIPIPDIITGLILHHKMDTGDITSNSLTNYAPSSTNSVVTGTITLQTGDKKVGTASARNTVSNNTQNIKNSVVVIPDATIGCNFSFWMKSITNITSGMFFSFLVGTARITIRTIAVNNVVRLEVNDGVNATTARNNLFTFTSNTWHHVSVNLHSIHPFVTCYVDGNIVTTSADGGGFRVMHSGNTYEMTIFGTAGGTEAQIWACDDFRIYNRNLSSIDVQSLFQLGV